MKKVDFDPRAKMLLFALACFCSMTISTFVFLVAFTGFIALMLILSGEVKTSLSFFAIFMLGAVVSFWSLHSEPSALTSIITAIFAFIRLLLPTMMAFVLLFKTTKISEFMSAFEKLHVPYVVVIPFTVMFRFFPTVKEEWDGIRNAMSFRGIGLGAKSLVLHPIVSVEHILVPLLFSCVSIMDELVAASLARGLDSDKKRTCYFNLKMKFYDYIVVLITLTFLAMVFILREA